MQVRLGIEITSMSALLENNWSRDAALAVLGKEYDGLLAEMQKNLSVRIVDGKCSYCHHEVGSDVSPAYLDLCERLSEDLTVASQAIARIKFQYLVVDILTGKDAEHLLGNVATLQIYAQSTGDWAAAHALASELVDEEVVFIAKDDLTEDEARARFKELLGISDEEFDEFIRSVDEQEDED